MKRIILLLLSIIPLAMNAKSDNDMIISIRILGENRIPISYASAFFMNNLDISGVSDDNGLLTLNIPSKPNKNLFKDTLIVSYIGYETYKISFNNLPKFNVTNLNNYYDIQLQIVEIKGALVIANPKKISKREAMKILLENVGKQMKIDFPKKNKSYKIKSDMYVQQGDVVIGLDEAIGVLYERPEGKRRWSDSLVFFDVHKRSYYMDTNLEEAIKSVKESAKDTLTIQKKKISNKKKRKLEKRNKMISEINLENILHEVFWGVNPIYPYRDFAKKTRRWEATEFDNGQTILVYTEKKNYIGIVKYKLVITYYINTYTYSINEVNQKLDMKINIPFGYKLKEDELKIFNAFNFSGNKIDKFRIKKMDGSVERNAKFIKRKNEVSPTEKTMVARGRAVNRKGKGVELNNLSKIIVLE